MTRETRFFVALLTLIACGCAAKRELSIVSEPPDAVLRLDDTIVGRTPYRTEFEAFGKRRVTLYADGYRTYSEVIELKAPWYAQFPFDLFSEVLIPVGWKYRKDVHVVLEPAVGGVGDPDLQGVLDRAEALRKAGPEGPRPAQPVPRTPQ